MQLGSPPKFFYDEITLKIPRYLINKMVDCSGKSTWIIVLAVYSGVLTGGLVGYLVYKFVKSRVSTTLLYTYFFLL